MTETNLNPRLLELHIEGFKSIRDQTIALQPLTVLIGANGAGKSNLIQFISMLSHMQTGNLQRWVAMQGWADQILHFGAKTTPTMKVRIDFQTGSGRNWYGFELSANNNNEFAIWNEKLGFQRKGTDGYFEVDLQNDGGRESYFSIVKPGERVLGLTPTQTKTATVIGGFLRKFQAYQFHDTTPLARIRQSSESHLDRFLASDAGNLATWLYRLQRTHPASFLRIESTVRDVFPDFGGFDLDEDPFNGKIRFQWHHAGRDEIFKASQFSDGTLRFIALCALLLQPFELMPHVVLVDEPELGLHPAALEVFAALAQGIVALGKQVIITTQSPSLLSRFSAENIVVVERESESTVFRSMANRKADLAPWLEKFDSLGQLWEMNLLGGQP